MSEVTIPETAIDRYRLIDKGTQAELDRLKGDYALMGSDDIAILRMMVQESVNSGNFALAEKLMSTLAKCSNAALSHAQVSRDLIPRTEVVAIARVLIGIVLDHTRPILSQKDFGNLADSLIYAIQQSIDSAPEGRLQNG
ncbi:hypothetical protein [Stieleria varia]|uniref:Uncharacterized protein n=1 Tax=Stieleria varia TaxID=2528005 RepID=A0A5C6AGN3_9BACT|nr:hypothetical protein [Stieleria varia]TWT98587.1 hypothetical protein Pla52n_51030 [Stieleria varia]